MVTLASLEGYLDTDYLSGEYMAGLFGAFVGMQVNMIIADQKDAAGMQASMIKSDIETSTGTQALMATTAQASSGMQALMNIVAKQSSSGMSSNMVIGASPVSGMEVKADTLRHATHDVYLVEGGYLEDAYLAARMCAFLGMEVLMQVVAKDTPTGQQVEAFITPPPSSFAMQSKMVVETTDPGGMQADMIRVDRKGFQATMVIYNITQLRLLCSFPSRGTPALNGLNWTASSSAFGDDFGVENLNTDIVEQVWRSFNFLSATLTCDTGISQGTTLDTVAILNHNLTTSAVVQVQGDNSSGFASPNVVFNMTVEELNMYHIAPTFPTGVINQNRFWRFIISDPTNPSPYIEIGTILFGNADIFTRAENYENPIGRKPIHFKDEIETEGFTNIMNDRSLKETLTLRFKDLRFLSGNFNILSNLQKTARTSNKCLIIPTPEFPSRHAVFAKLVELPNRDHTGIDEENEYVSLTMDWDESK